MRSYHPKSDMEHGEKAKNLLFLKINVKFALLVPGQCIIAAPRSLRELNGGIFFCFCFFFLYYPAHVVHVDRIVQPHFEWLRNISLESY